MGNGGQINDLIWVWKEKWVEENIFLAYSKIAPELSKIGLEFEKTEIMNKMNALLIFFFGILFLASTDHSIAQSTDEIAQAIQSGSSRDLARYFSSSVALDINNPPGDYSKNQAELIFRDFFKKSPPNEFEIVHQGEYSHNIWYFIGNYRSDEADYKVLVKGKLENGAISVYSVDFNKE